MTKVVFITGAARRIGAIIASTFHTAGYNVVIHHNQSAGEAEALSDSLNDKRADSATTIHADLVTKLNASELIESVVRKWGQLDVLVNNASAFYPTPFGEIKEYDWDILIGSNLKAPTMLTQAAAPALTENGGSIINIVDIHADRPLKNYPVYSIAKAGLVALTKSTAKELGPKVRCNAVAPGAILWPEQPDYEVEHQDIIERTALKREGAPEDIANTVLFLADSAPYITGQIIAVDGGRTLHT